MHQHLPTTLGELLAHLDPRLSGYHYPTVHHQIEIVLGLGDEEAVAGVQVAHLRDHIAHHTERDLHEHDQAALGLALDACNSWLDERRLCFDCRQGQAERGEQPGPSPASDHLWSSCLQRLTVDLLWGAVHAAFPRDRSPSFRRRASVDPPTFREG